MDGLEARIRQARVKAGFRSAAEAARRLSMDPHAYRHYEAGTRVPPTSRFPDIARLFRVSLEWLISGKDPANGDTINVMRLWSRIEPENRDAALRMLEGLSGDEKKSA
jgi:transcriptional regulator with XRE-family HTH domain